MYDLIAYYDTLLKVATSPASLADLGPPKQILNNVGHQAHTIDARPAHLVYCIVYSESPEFNYFVFGYECVNRIAPAQFMRNSPVIPK